MPIFHPSTMKGKTVSSRPMRGGAFLLGNTLGGLQDAEGIESALAGNGLGMGMCGGMSGMPRMSGMSRNPSGMSSINKKLESLMVKASKPKPKNIKFSM
jgi:hypothetical protein